MRSLSRVRGKPFSLHSATTEVKLNVNGVVWGLRLKANWYLTLKLRQNEQFELKRLLVDAFQTAAVEVFSEWLTKLVVEKEVAKGNGGGAGKAKVVLCGHRYAFCAARYDPGMIQMGYTSMGGLLAADALIQFVQNRPDANAPLWPRIVACLAFDTPVRSNVAPCIAGT